MSLQSRFAAALDFDAFLGVAQQNLELWRALYARARIPEELASRVAALPGRWHLLVLSEDWCGDAVNTIPALARLVAESPNLELRILSRDANPDLMDARLTNGSRSIPVVMVLDESFEEFGWWGPRPAPLQRWVREEGLALPKDERYLKIRQWYARDQGRTTLTEVVELLERAAAAAHGSIVLH